MAALGLLALTMPASPWLRSGCNLVPEGAAKLLLVARDGRSEPVSLEHDDVVRHLRAIVGDLKLDHRTGRMSKERVTALIASVKKSKSDE